MIKVKEGGTDTISERETREKKVRETRAAEKLRSPSENLPDPKTLNNCRNCHRLVVKKLSTTWFMDRANSSKGKI